MSDLLYNSFTYWFIMLWNNLPVWWEAIRGVYGIQAAFWSFMALIVSGVLVGAVGLIIKWLWGKQWMH